MSDRCSCVPDGPNYRCGIGRPCDVHGNVDALMAWGKYVDRRGKQWGLCEEPACPVAPHWWSVFPYAELTPAQMRHRIEREQHRETCRGLYECLDHPVPTVWASRTSRLTCFAVTVGSDMGIPRRYQTFAEAIDAAQQLTKETP